MTVERGGPVGRGSFAALARAESAGAAPGTEFRFPSAVESSPPGGRRSGSQRRSGGWRYGVAALAACALAASAWHAGAAAYVHAKASLGQWLLQRAWDESRERGAAVKPWPWADTHPVARISLPSRGVDLLVLAGANGRTLAWGPGHAERSSPPGAAGNAVVTAHRDTHFAFLRDVQPGDAIVVETASRARYVYRVERSFVADHRALRLPDDDTATLSLVTCYPFDSLDARTPLRYAVIARADRAGGG